MSSFLYDNKFGTLDPEIASRDNSGGINLSAARITR